MNNSKGDTKCLSNIKKYTINQKKIKYLTINRFAALVAYFAIVEFDNVVIKGPDIPDAGPSGYSVILRGKLAATWCEIRRGK